MEIVENAGAWKKDFENGWLTELKIRGRINWSLYQYAQNTQSPSGNKILLKEAKLLLITSAGSYLKNDQPPFDAANPLGDYTIRTFPASTPPGDLEFAHDHYKQDSVRSDPQVLIPIGHLEELVAQDKLHRFCSPVISFMGYQPDVSRVLSDTIPAIQAVIDNSDVDCVLLVPS